MSLVTRKRLRDLAKPTGTEVPDARKHWYNVAAVFPGQNGMTKATQAPPCTIGKKKQVLSTGFKKTYIELSGRIAAELEYTRGRILVTYRKPPIVFFLKNCECVFSALPL